MFFDLMTIQNGLQDCMKACGTFGIKQFNMIYFIITTATTTNDNDNNNKK